MIKKRILGVIVSSCIMVGAFTGCGNEEKDLSQSDGTESIEPSEETFVQIGVAVQNGEYHGLIWEYTNANELLITGNLEKGYPENNSWYEWESGEYLAPWGQYAQEVKGVNLAFSGAETLAGFFYNWSSLNSVYLRDLDTGNVTDMSYMFSGCGSLVSLDLRDLDTSKVTDMKGMFGNCINLESLDLSGFNTGRVTDMSVMFYSCDKLMNLDIHSFDTSSVMDMSHMFSDCNNLGVLNLSGFDTSSVADMRAMFNSCYNLSSLDVSSFNTKAVTNMSEMFESCYSLSSLDLSSFDVGNVMDMKGMFEGCFSLQEILVGDRWQTPTYNDDMFTNCETDHVTYK